MRRWLGRLGLYTLGLAFVAAGIFGVAQATVLSDAGEAPTERAIKPVGVERTLPKPVDESAIADQEDKEEPEKKPEQEIEQVEKAIEEPDPKIGRAHV